MKKVFTTFLHSTAKEQEHIIFSAGKIGYQVEVAPEDLAKVMKTVLGCVDSSKISHLSVQLQSHLLPLQFVLARLQ